MSESSAREDQVELDYGEGGVPWPLLIYYLGFLTFFTWYCLEFQLPDFLKQGPGASQVAAPEDSGAGGQAPGE